MTFKIKDTDLGYVVTRKGERTVRMTIAHSACPSMQFAQYLADYAEDNFSCVPFTRILSRVETVADWNDKLIVFYDAVSGFELVCMSPRAMSQRVK